MPLMQLLLMEVRDVGQQRLGAVTGLYFAFGELGGFGGPVLVGLLRSATGGFQLPLVLFAILSMGLIPLVPSLDDPPVVTEPQ